MDSQLRWRVLLVLCVIFLPAAVTFSLPPLIFDASLFEFAPYYNDEVEYWHETLTFTRVGFSGGYYTLDEHPASAPFSHFGCHGPAFPVLYGAIGLLLGWQLDSAPLIHLLLVTLALAFFLFLTRPKIRQLALAATLLGTFSPLLLMLTSSMQDSVHHAIAIIMAGVLGAWIDRTEVPSPWTRLGLVALVLLASLIRLSWVVLLLPVMTLPRRRDGLTTALASAAAIVLGAGAAFVFGYLAAPHPDAPVSRLFETQELSVVLERARVNLANLFAIRSAHPLEVFQRYGIMAMIVAALTTAVLRSIGSKPDLDRNTSRRGAVAESLFHIVNLGLPLGMSILMYDIFDWRDYRVLSAHFLLSLLVAIMLGSRRRLIAVLLLGQILMMPAFFSAYREFSGFYFRVDRNELERFRQELQVIQYEPDTDAWCNTLLTSLDDHRLVAVPPGIGISYLFSHVDLPLKSRYVLLDEEWTRRNAALVQRLELDPLRQMAFGTLYYNRSAACD